MGLGRRLFDGVRCAKGVSPLSTPHADSAPLICPVPCTAMREHIVMHCPLVVFNE